MRENCDCDAPGKGALFHVIASEAKQSIAWQNGWMDCFVAFSLRKRFAFVAGNDGQRFSPIAVEAVAG